MLGERDETQLSQYNQSLQKVGIYSQGAGEWDSGDIKLGVSH